MSAVPRLTIEIEEEFQIVDGAETGHLHAVVDHPVAETVAGVPDLVLA